MWKIYLPNTLKGSELHRGAMEYVESGERVKITWLQSRDCLCGCGTSLQIMLLIWDEFWWREYEDKRLTELTKKKIVKCTWTRHHWTANNLQNCIFHIAELLFTVSVQSNYERDLITLTEQITPLLVCLTIPVHPATDLHGSLLILNTCLTYINNLHQAPMSTMLWPIHCIWPNCKFTFYIIITRWRLIIAPQ